MRHFRIAAVIVFLGAGLLLSSAALAGHEKAEPAKPRESWITFLSQRSGRNLLYKMRPDGSGTTPIFGGKIENVPILTDGVTLYREPHWTRQSPDGKHFASWVYDRGTPDSKYHGLSRAMLYVGGLNGDWSRVLNSDAHEVFAWSPESTRIAFSIFSGSEHKQGYLRSRLRSTEIVVAGIDGSNEDYVLEQPGTWAVCDWSPDGKRLLLRKTPVHDQPKDVDDLLELDLVALRAARARSLQLGEGLPRRGHQWAATAAADFLKRVFARSQGIDPNGARYSPDGKYIAVEYADPAKMYAPNECVEPSRSLHMMRYLGKLAVLEIATGNMKTTADYAYGLRGPICWSPDGEQILFSRYLPKDDDREKMEDEHGLAIWAIRKDGRDARFLTTGWSPDWR